MLRIFLWFILLNFFSLKDTMCQDNASKKDSIAIYHSIQAISNDVNIIGDFWRTIEITLDYKEMRYQIYMMISDESTDVGGSIRFVSQGFFRIESKYIIMKDMNNYFIHLGLIANDSLYYLSGIKFMENINFHRILSFSYITMSNYFTSWNNKIADHFKLKTRKQSKSKLINGKYVSKMNSLYILIKDNYYEINLLFENYVISKISCGNLEFKKGKLILKDRDNLNIIECYISNKKIYPINHLPTMYNNKPLILEKK